jgi:hypothetical protein
MMKLKYYTDPGHGWVAVKRTVVRELGIANQITYFSYQKGKTVYLEEDGDAALLIDALRARGKEFTVEPHTSNNRSPIRTYERYHPAG